MIGLFIFYISSWFSLGRLFLSKNLSISSRLLSFLGHIIACSSLLWSLYFYGVSFNFSFISNFIDLSILSFLLDELAKGLSVLFIFSKSQLLVSLIFAIVFISISFISAFVFMISFLQLTFFFPSVAADVLPVIALDTMLCHLFEIFLVLKVGLYCYKPRS